MSVPGTDAVDRIRRIKAAIERWDNGDESAVDVVAQIELIASEPWATPKLGSNHYSPEVQT